MDNTKILNHLHTMVVSLDEINNELDDLSSLSMDESISFPWKSILEDIQDRMSIIQDKIESEGDETTRNLVKLSLTLLSEKLTKLTIRLEVYFKVISNREVE